MADVRVQEAGSIRVSVGDRIEDLDTPLILADLDQMERNIADWQSWMDACGVRFRVHIKTHKVPEIALLQLAAGARGICCAKVSEAEPFAAAYASTTSPSRTRSSARTSGPGWRSWPPPACG